MKKAADGRGRLLLWYEEQRLGTPGYQQGIIRAVSEAFKDYCTETANR